jgi:hypothetical protein
MAIVRSWFSLIEALLRTLSNAKYSSYCNLYQNSWLLFGIVIAPILTS